MKKRIYAIIISLMLVFGTGVAATQAGVIGPKLEEKLQSLGPGEEVSVIIYLSDKVDVKVFKEKDKAIRSSKIIKALIDKKNATQKDLLKLLKKNEVKEALSFWIFNGIAARVPASLVDELVGLTGVEAVKLDAKVTLPPEPTLAGTPAESSTPEWNIDSIRAPELWSLGYDGTNVVVATMDSGVDPNHPDIGPAYRGGENSWYDPNGEHAAPYDASGHGTQALGLIIGGDEGGSAIGVAPGAQWIAAKIFNDAGVAELSKIHEGFQWVLDPDGNLNTDDGPDIVNNSWFLDGTRNQCNGEFADDIAVLRAVGIAVVFAAGNSGPSMSSSVSPANDPESFAVGAVDALSNVAYFSSRGPSACDGDIYPRVVTPGVSVRTSDLTFGGIFPNSYMYVTGTSFAAPHVSGAMALLLSAVPGATVSELQSAIADSAVDLGSAGPDNVSGAGRLDVIKAYDLLGAGDPPPPQPGSLHFSEASYSVAENGGSFVVKVTRTGGSDGTVGVDYASTDGTAAAGEDYEAASGTLTFAEGETSQTFTMIILEDSVYEGDEDLNLTLSNPTGGASLESPASAPLTIVENDPVPQPGSLQFSEASYSVAEDSISSIMVTVTRTGGSDGMIAVDYATSDGTATVGEDYEAASGALTFLDGETSQTFALNVLDDTDYEGDENLILTLSNPTGGATLGEPGSATVTIIEDDPPPGPADDDSDGFTADVDCNDNDDSIYPGAPEIKHDGIDQDCNGYDLTIDITRARYLVSKDKIIVWATSGLGDQAGLKVTINLAAGGSITKNMTWKATKSRWQKAIKNFTAKFGSQPVSVAVFGVEGSESQAVELR